MSHPLLSLKHFGFSVLVVACAAIPVNFVYAQTSDVSSQCTIPTGAAHVTLSGFISDPSGAMLHGAFVTLTCGTTTLQATTDATGRYTLQLLPSTYSLVVAAKGFTTKQQPLKVSCAGNNSQDLILNIAQDNSSIEVRAGANGYEVNESSEATRTDTPIREIPQAVYVIPQQLLRDEQVIRLADAVRNVSGVTLAEDAGGRQERVTMRGFVTDTTFQDGFRNGPSSNATFSDFANVERMDILKGPSSTVFGRLDPGGVVNLVTKQPLSEHYYSVTMQGGSYQLLRPTIDASGPLTTNKALLYRFIASGQDSGSFRDF